MRKLVDGLTRLGLFVLIAAMVFLGLLVLATIGAGLLVFALAVMPLALAWAAVYGPDRVDVGSERIH